MTNVMFMASKYVLSLALTPVIFLAPESLLLGAKNTSLLVNLKKSISFQNVIYSEGASSELRANYGIMIIFCHTNAQL